MLTISDDSINLIVTEEVSGQLQYVKHYTHFEWPGGSSGPTVAIGYDCGYVTPAEARADWAGILDQSNVDAIIRACGKHGAAAHDYVIRHRTEVAIMWDQAMAEFRSREIPKWIGRVAAHLPNLDKLAPDSLGALVSLAYNRGPSFDAEGDRYREMRAIKAHMALAQFAAVPADILAMQRLWPQGGDLWRRRAHEAALFRKGLGAPVAASPAPPQDHPAPSAPSQAAPSVAPALPSIADTLARIAAFIES